MVPTRTRQVNTRVSVPTCLAVLIRTSEPSSERLQVLKSFHIPCSSLVFPIVSLPTPRRRLEARVTWSQAGCPKGMCVCSPYFLTAPGQAHPRAFELSHRADGGSSPAESRLATSCEEPGSQEEAGVPWKGLGGVATCHKLFELNVGNISLVSRWRPSPSRAASWEQEMAIWKIDGARARFRHQSLIRLVLILTAFKQ